MEDACNHVPSLIKVSSNMGRTEGGSGFEARTRSRARKGEGSEGEPRRAGQSRTEQDRARKMLLVVSVCTFGGVSRGRLGSMDNDKKKKKKKKKKPAPDLSE